MDAGRIHRAMFRTWEIDPAYSRMRSFEVRTPYREQLPKYTAQFERLREVVKVEALNGKEALIVGPGLSPDEAVFVLGTYPGLIKLHLVDWHEPNIKYLERVFTDWEKENPEYRKTELHVADAACIETISNDSVGLVFMHQVIESLDYLDHVVEIFKEMRRVLAGGGVLFTLGSRIDERLKTHLNNMGFVRVPNRLGLVQDDIWRKVA